MWALLSHQLPDVLLLLLRLLMLMYKPMLVS
jgi:hypothetical protein